MSTTYVNGAIPASALVAISGRAGSRLLSGPAASWERVFAEVFRRYGWSPTPTGPNDAYRSLAVQVSTFLDRYIPAKTGGGVYGDIRWWNGVRYVRKAGKAAAAVPGTSNHGKGRAVDVTGLGGFGGQRYAEFAVVAEPLGWSNTEGRSVNEPWHWVDLASPELVSSGHAIVPGVPTVTNPVLPTAVALRRTRTRGADMQPVIYLFEGMPAPGLGIYAHNGGFVNLTNAEEKANLMRKPTDPVPGPGAVEVWVTAGTATNLINDARGANDFRG